MIFEVSSDYIYETPKLIINVKNMQDKRGNPANKLLDQENRVDKIKIRPVDFDNEEELKKVLKRACPPAQASTLFKRHMNFELSLRIRAQSRNYVPMWSKPAFWVGVGAVYAAALIFLGLISIPSGNTVIYSNSTYSDNSSSSSSPSSSLQPSGSDDSLQPYVG